MDAETRRLLSDNIMMTRRKAHAASCAGFDEVEKAMLAHAAEMEAKFEQR